MKRQYVGCAGQVANAINIVYCIYASSREHGQVGARAYLPKLRHEAPRRIPSIAGRNSEGGSWI